MDGRVSILWKNFHRNSQLSHSGQMGRENGCRWQQSRRQILSAHTHSTHWILNSFNLWKPVNQKPLRWTLQRGAFSEYFTFGGSCRCCCCTTFTKKCVNYLFLFTSWLCGRSMCIYVCNVCMCKCYTIHPEPVLHYCLYSIHIYTFVCQALQFIL